MARVTKTHALAINKLMMPLICTVAHPDYVCEDADLGYYDMLVSDIAHNAAALSVFNMSLDAEVLHDNIMRQDTNPREHFYAVLKYIEDNALINKRSFACS
jgi:hypothetical protein